METPKSKVRKVFNTIGSFFQKSYSVIIGIGTLITSIATIYLMSIQNNLQLKSNEIQRVANLPHFSVKYYTSDLNSDEIHETEYIEISNIGKPTYSPTSVTLNFFYDVRNKNGETRRIPITGYYNLRFVTDALEGRIFKASNPYNFQDYISTERTSNFYVQKMTLVRIDYTDIYVTRHSLFYKENRVISEQEYNDIINSAIEQSYKHDEITEQDLIALFWYKAFVSLSELYQKQYERVMREYIRMIAMQGCMDNPHLSKSINQLYMSAAQQLHDILLGKNEMTNEERIQKYLEEYNKACENLSKYIIL